MENKKNMYGGNNFIFENMLNSVLEDKAKGKDKKSENLDSDTLIASILNTSFSILLNSKMENAKTVRGFQEVKNKMLGSSNFGVFRQYLISLLQSLAGMDLAQRDAYQKNIDFVNELFGKLQPLISDDKVFNTIKSGLVSKLVNNFEADLKKREDQLRKTDPTIYANAIKKGLVLKEEKRSGEEADVEEAEFRSTAFNKSKESLDAATAFVGIISRDKYIATLKANPDISKYEGIANDLYKKAQDLQLTDRAGIAKVVTPTGTFKAGEYKRQQDILINEIIRQKKEYERVKNAALKAGSSLDLVSATTPDPVCPPGMVYDRAKAACVSSEPVKDNTATTVPPKKKKPVTPVPTQVKTCDFPIKVGGIKCTQVGELQNKILELIPSAKSFLTTKGGSDKIYGKSTALVTNIIWGYISNNKNIETISDLTKEKYDAIMALTTNDIELDLSNITPVRDNLNTEAYFKTKIEESEIVLATPVLSFEEFSVILKENLTEGVMGEDGVIHDTGDMPIAKTKKILKDSCIKKSIESGKIEDCFGTKEEEKKKEEKKKEKVDPVPPTREEWKGLKYIQNGTYPVVFDESMLSFWTKEIAIQTVALLLPGSGLLIKAGTTGLRSLAIKGAAKFGAAKLAKKLAMKTAAKLAKKAVTKGTIRAISATEGKIVANQLSKMSVNFFKAYKKIPIPKRLASGAIGATLGTATLDFISGKDSYTIEIVEGFIDRGVVLAIAGGMVNTIDGYVSDDDLACIATVLSVIKGAWTLNSDGNAVSAWSVLKNAYQTKEGESIIGDIDSISAKMGDVEGFPSLRSSTPLSAVTDMDWDFALSEVKTFLQKIESNEAKLLENIKKLPKSYTEAFLNGDFAEYDENGEIEGMDLDAIEPEEEIKTIDTAKTEDKGTGFNL